MEEKHKKCSIESHSEIDAVSYCQECNKYLCNKCQNNHADFHEERKLINLKNKDEIFEDICKEIGHKNKLEFFCKDHNTLCCVACTSKMKLEGYGQHHDCNVCKIIDIKEEKKNKLKENLNNLELLNNQIEQSINDLNKIYEEINKNKEDLKIKVQAIFTKIRNALTEKENKLLNDIEEEYNKKFFKEDLVKESKSLPNQIKKSIDKGKKIEKEWNDDNLPSLINDCINIEENIKKVNKINNNIKESKSNKETIIEFDIEEEDINNLIKKIQTFGNIISPLNLYDNYNIENKNPIHILQKHDGQVYWLCVLKDGRLASCSNDKKIIIYNKNTYNPDITIESDSNNCISFITQLSSGLLVSCCDDQKIRFFEIKELEYQLIQTLKEHQNDVYYLIELKNKNLVSCSRDCSINFYKKDNILYKLYYKHQTKGGLNSVLQTKENEICYFDYINKTLYFYDLIKKENKASISNIGINDGYKKSIILINKNLLIVPGTNEISIIDINQYKKVKSIEVPNAGDISSACILNRNMILTGDNSKTIRQWKIEGDNLIFISKKENALDSDKGALLNLKNGFIASGYNKTIKIW